MLFTEYLAFPLSQADLLHILIMLRHDKPSLNCTTNMKTHLTVLVVTIDARTGVNPLFTQIACLFKPLKVECSREILEVYIIFFKPDFIVPVYTDLMYPFLGLELDHGTLLVWAKHTAWDVSMRHNMLWILEILTQKKLAPFAIPRLVIKRILFVKISPVATGMHHYQAYVTDDQFFSFVPRSISGLTLHGFNNLGVEANVTVPIVFIEVVVIYQIWVHASNDLYLVV